MTEIIAHMRANGFDVDGSNLILDGKVHRFGDKKKSNWLIGFQNHSRGGQIFHVVQYGTWKTGDVFTYKTNVELDGDDKVFIQKKINEAKEKAAAEKIKIQTETADACAKFWETLGESELTDYCIRKQIRSLYGARSKNSEIYIPVRDETGKLWGLQRIQNDGGKYFSPGQKIKGCFHTIGEIRGAETIYVAEGFATGASIYAAIERPVVVSFNSGNIGPTCEAIRRLNPETKIVICGDDDKWSERNAGREAAEKIDYATSVFPKFKDEKTKPTDWNDVFCLEGIDAVREQIAPVRAKRWALIPLGFREGEYFFTSTDNPQITAVNSFSSVELFKLMPVEYWEQAFPGQKAGINWTKAQSDLMRACRARGIFEPKKIRGSGIWIDSGRVVVNQGDHLMIDGSRFEIGDIKSKFFYTLGKSLPELSCEPLENCELLIEICEAFKWQKKEFAPLMSGALVISKICGALPIRPHLWLTGGSQTGKTTLLERLISPTLDGYSLNLLGGTSEAGLRQSLGSNSIPVIFDEFETNGSKSSENIQACVELMRSAWSETSGSIAKGSASGNAAFYQPRFSAIVSSIRTNLINDADRSRFTVLELAPHGSDEKHWQYLSQLLTRYDKRFIDGLFVRSLKILPAILASYDVLRKELASKVGARFGQQYGMLLAGYWSLKSTDPITHSESRGLLAAMDLDEEKVEAKVTDEIELLGFIKTTAIRGEHSPKLIQQMIIGASQPMPVPKDVEILETVGIRVMDEFVAIASQHTELRKLLRDTKWQNCWSKSLSRLDGAQKNSPVRIGGGVTKCTKIPVTYFLGYKGYTENE